MTDCSFSVEVVGEVIQGDRRIKVIDNEIDGFIFPPSYKSLLETEENLIRSLSSVDISIATALLGKWLLGGDLYGTTETESRGSIDSQEE
ncbi:MAG: hypothetical protein QIT35_gp35 [Methanophagales virus PBV299]|uniref:Uncharacterized protein n=1 Tax=Methanophagales virus PBV299 TaxID=2987730 RepID=A0ABY6GLX7_9CAUD|nr:MAG: hypothetical protein QIT35_gp35 [Methanophagales virus PBV299]UYL64831.1 MAG: hypothetical protein OFDIEDLO_00035 [Methanophagales virus PBV299]